MDSNRRAPHGQRQSSGRAHRTSTRLVPRLHTDTPPQAHNRFSFQDTPVEDRAPASFSSPTNSVIDESPISPASTFRSLPPYEQSVPGHLSVEKAAEANTQLPPVGMHPAYHAPVAEVHPQQSYPRGQTPVQRAPSRHVSEPVDRHGPSQAHIYAPQLENHSIPHSKNRQSPLQHASPATRGPGKQDTKIASQPQNFAPPPRIGTYNPTSLAGPDTSAAPHRPGQVSHPNSALDTHWRHSLCEPDPLCCLGLFCPCIVYGRTTYRLSLKADRKDPTDMLGQQTLNGSCGLFTLACGLQGILSMIHRTRIRKLYRIEGSVLDDCVLGCCCCCCVVAQNEREIRDREERLRRQAGPVKGGEASVGYVSPPVGGMSYAPP